MSCCSKSFRARTRCSLFALIKLCAVIHSSHQNAQHWKQYELCLLLLSQFPHFTPAVWHSLMASTSSKLLIRKFVGRSLRFPLVGTWTSLRYSGHAMILWRPIHYFIKSRSSSEDTNCANMAVSLDQAAYHISISSHISCISAISTNQGRSCGCLVSKNCL